MNPTPRAARACAIWLQACLELGWQKSDLDFMEALWWKHHDERGNLIETGNQAPQRSERLNSERSAKDMNVKDFSLSDHERDTP